jgi:predicted methyltransferase
VKKPEEECDRSYFSGHAKNHISKPSLFWRNRMLSECRRLLNKDGRLFIYSPHPTHFIQRAKSNGLFVKKMNHT